MRIDLKSEKPPRGVCTHEAGHAVVANSFGVPVQANWVAFTEEKGWHGGTDHAQGSVEHLHYMDQATILMAGKTAEELFGCPAHETAWRKDLGQISVLLNANRIPEDEHWVRISEARERALSILETSRNKALKLIDRLVECGRVERPEFVRLMNGETS